MTDKQTRKKKKNLKKRKNEDRKKWKKTNERKQQINNLAHQRTEQLKKQFAAVIKGLIGEPG